MHETYSPATQMSMVLASINIQQLRATCHLGIHPWEKRWPQVILIDVQLSLTQLPKEDVLDPQSDYASVACYIQQFCRENECNLLETLTEKLGHALQQQFGFLKLTLTITKPHALPNSHGASVSLTFDSKH